MKMHTVAGTIAMLASCNALAAVTTLPQALPEPGSFELLTIAGVVALVVSVRNRNK